MDDRNSEICKMEESKRMKRRINKRELFFDIMTVVSTGAVGYLYYKFRDQIFPTTENKETNTESDTDL